MTMASVVNIKPGRCWYKILKNNYPIIFLYIKKFQMTLFQNTFHFRYIIVFCKHGICMGQIGTLVCYS